MPVYHSLGNIPKKRHTVFRNPKNNSLYQEHLVGTYGFSGPQSLLYRIYRPTEILETRFLRQVNWEADPDPTLRMRHFFLEKLERRKSATMERIPLLYNNDLAISFVHTDQSDDFFYRNAEGDELLYVSEGEGVFESEFGTIPYRAGDHIIVPRSILYRLEIEIPSRFLVLESRDALRPPKRYLNPFGQFQEHSPYCERDILRPQDLPVHNERGEHRIVVKKGNGFHEVILGHHPFDVVGWDGYYYPWIFNIEDFEPITGSLHQPPPVHQTFEANGFVLCAFVPRLFDFHPQAVPAPYNHSNVMSDEVLYYANDEFMSRKGIEYGSLTLHPLGLPHGPQPGKMEASIGVERTNELAVMIDTFKPLTVAKNVLDVEDTTYGSSWNE